MVIKRCMTLRAATPDDLAAIARIQHESPEASQWEPSHYLRYDCVVVEFPNAEIAGFLVSRATAPGEREILNVAVTPAHRRGGLARALMQRELENGSGEWFLEVRESNLAAIRLYRSLGFRQVGRREQYYGPPNTPEACIVMRFFS